MEAEGNPSIHTIPSPIESTLPRSTTRGSKRYCVIQSRCLSSREVGGALSRLFMVPVGREVFELIPKVSAQHVGADRDLQSGQ